MVSRISSGQQHGRPVEAAPTQLGQCLVGLLQRVWRGRRHDTHLRHLAPEVEPLLARELGHRQQLAFFPQQAAGQAWDVAHVDACAHRLQRQRHKVARRTKMRAIAKRLAARRLATAQRHAIAQSAATVIGTHHVDPATHLERTADGFGGLLHPADGRLRSAAPSGAHPLAPAQVAERADAHPGNHPPAARPSGLLRAGRIPAPGARPGLWGGRSAQIRTAPSCHRAPRSDP